VWQTEQAVARLPPWASVNSSMPPPREESWQTLQLPIVATVVWYWTACALSEATEVGTMA